MAEAFLPFSASSTSALQGHEETPSPGLRDGESLIFEGGAEELFHFQAWGRKDSEPWSHFGFHFRLTNERVMWVDNKSGIAKSIPLARVRRQERGGCYPGEAFCKLVMESGATVVVRCWDVPGNIDLLEKFLAQALERLWKLRQLF